MKIWIINHYALGPSGAGGTRHFSLARELVLLGHEVTILASSFDHGLQRELRLVDGERVKEELVDSVRFLWIRTPSYKGNGWRRVWNMLSFGISILRGRVNRRLPRPDVIIGSSPHLFAGLAAWCQAKRVGVPFVMEVRDIWPETLVALGNISSHHPFIRLLAYIERFLYRRADRIISLLPMAEPHFLSHGARPESFVWIPNGVDLRLLPPATDPPREGPFRVIYAGAHGLANALDTILEAAAILESQGLGPKDVEILLVGDGPDKARLKARAVEMELSLVTFLDPVPKNEVYSLLETASAFFMLLVDSPLFKWGVSPNKLFDYMGSARPVIFGVSSPFNPVLESGSGITVQPGDADAFARAVNQLRDLPWEERREMGRCGRNYVKARHDISEHGATLASVLEDVVRKG